MNARVLLMPQAAADLFAQESAALDVARAVHADPAAGVEQQRQALGELSNAFERLLRETRRLVRRSDREELEMNRLNQRLNELATELEHRATHDSLTGVLNRAAIIDRATRQLRRDCCALIVLDIDNFKRVNDSFGHPIGDQVICGVVQRLQTLVPPSAEIGRVGGEEFTVVLPGWSLDAAFAMAQKLRLAIALHVFDLPDRHDVTASFGVSWLPRGSSFHDAYCQADEALYAAKRAGRNQVVRAEPAELPDVQDLGHSAAVSRLAAAE